MTTLMIITILLILGLLFVFLELFVPGGIIGLIGAALMIAATVLCFNEYGPATGMAVFLLCCVVVSIAVILFIKVLPHTAEGKWIIMSHTLVKAKGSHSETERHQSLVGQEGYSESELRPAGIAVIGGERLDVVTEGDYIDENTRIRVLRVDGNRIVVDRV
ncbi:MAG: NfeD family protein [Candidatus Hinthialibacter sp.]